MAGGQQYTDTVPRDTGHIAMILYQATNVLSAGTQISPVMMYDDEHVDIPWTTGVNGISGMPKDASIGYENLVYTTISGDMKWDKYAYMITDSAKLKSVDKQVKQKSLKSAAEYLAGTLDNHILTNLVAGAGQSRAATDVWSAAGADIEQDIKNMWSDCVANSNANTSEIMNCYLVVPADVFAEVKSLQLINNITTDYETYFGKTFGLKVIPSRDYGSSSALVNQALFLFGGDNTSVTFRYSPSAAAANGVPLVETERVVGKGDGYIAQQAQFTAIIEDSAGAGTTNRIGVITGVRS
jgi:hypothetical protein